MRNQSNRKYLVVASARIAAAPAQVYAIIANYRQGHPRILPKEFSGLTVEQGGIGAGTIIRFQMTVFGKTKHFRAAITEPDPGRVLVETNLEEAGAVSTFTVNPGQSPQDSEVTISTELVMKSGAHGAIERILITWVLRGIYRRELELLAVTTRRGC